MVYSRDETMEYLDSLRFYAGMFIIWTVVALIWWLLSWWKRRPRRPSKPKSKAPPWYAGLRRSEMRSSPPSAPTRGTGPEPSESRGASDEGE